MAAWAATLAATPCVADEWRLATSEEIVASWGQGLGATANNQVIADFDGNGVSDAARILRSESTGKLFLFVALNEGTPSHRLLRLNQMDGLGIALIQPGSHQTLCGKGYDCPDGGPDTMTLKWPALGVFKPGSASWIMYWDDSAREFREFGTTD